MNHTAGKEASSQQKDLPEFQCRLLERSHGTVESPHSHHSSHGVNLPHSPHGTVESPHSHHSPHGVKVPHSPHGTVRSSHSPCPTGTNTTPCTSTKLLEEEVSLSAILASDEVIDASLRS